MFMPRQKKTTICPLGGVGVGGKWKFQIWHHLLDGPRRFGELQRLIPQASRQMLTIQLRELEQAGAIRRKVYPQMPPKVEYSLTDLGRSVEPLVRQVYDWGEWYDNQVGQGMDWFIKLSGRWTFWIWYHLLSGPKRFCELQRLIPRANRQTLALQLRELEEMGVLYRKVVMQGSPKVGYALTELGQRSEPLLRQMYAWGRWYCERSGLEYDWPVSDTPQERIGSPPALVISLR
jgi:DNA-binding HxlR family transcriptional regulator